MCQYSLEGYPSRAAKHGEALELRQIDDKRSHVGFFGATARRASNLVCVKPGALLTLDKVAFTRLAHLWEDHKGCFSAARTWQGKTDVVVKMATWQERDASGCDYERYSDALQFPDGVKMHLCFFAMGTMALVGERLPGKATKPRDLDQALGLDQIPAKAPKEVVREAASASA